MDMLAPNPNYDPAKRGPGSPNIYMNSNVEAAVQEVLAKLSNVELCGVMWGLADQLGFHTTSPSKIVPTVFDLIEQQAEFLQEQG